MSDGDDSFLSGLKHNFLNPVVVISCSILVSVFILIGTAIFGFDKGVLAGMSRVDFARGLITYLFAIVTIGTAVVLVVSALTGADDPQNDKRFERGKEILSLLLGVFGTIVGFYFGSEVSAKGAAAEQVMHVIPLRLSASAVTSKSPFELQTFISGGQPPYRYGITVGSGTPEANTQVDGSGWITATLTAPDVSSEQPVPVKVLVKDSDAHTTEGSTSVRVTPPR